MSICQNKTPIKTHSQDIDLQKKMPPRLNTAKNQPEQQHQQSYQQQQSRQQLQPQSSPQNPKPKQKSNTIFLQNQHPLQPIPQTHTEQASETHSMKIIGQESVLSNRTEQIKQKNLITKRLDMFQLTRTEHFWDYLSLSWIFCFIFAVKDDSLCLDNPTNPGTSMREYLYIEGSTTVALFFFLLIITIVMRNCKNTQNCFLTIIAAFCMVASFLIFLFKLIWPFQIFLSTLLNLNFQQCNQFLLQYFIAYLIGVYYLGKLLNEIQTGQNKYLTKQQQLLEQILKRKQEHLIRKWDVQNCWLINFKDFYLEYYRYESEKRVSYCLTTIFGMYLILRDTRSVSLGDWSSLKVMIVMSFCVEMLLPVVNFVRAGVRRCRACRKKDPQIADKNTIIAQQITQQQPSPAPKKPPKKYTFLFLSKSTILAVWQLSCLALALALFTLTMIRPLSDHSDSLKQYLLIYFLFRLVYYRDAVLIFCDLKKYEGGKFVEQAMGEILGRTGLGIRDFYDLYT